jgi:Protein of unknown function (DUF2924)
MQAETLEAEIAQLSNLGLAELRKVWVERVGRAPQLTSTELTRRWLAWELQAARRGGLDAATRRRLRQLTGSVRANPIAIAARHVSVKPGTVLAREWAGTIHKVVVLDGSFSWNGRTWTSLSEIATRITGTRWSGPRFFGLRGKART